MATIVWRHNVTYNPNKQTVTFLYSPLEGNEAVSLIDYYRELYPHKTWIELAILAIPEIELIPDKEKLVFLM